MKPILRFRAIARGLLQVQPSACAEWRRDMGDGDNCMVASIRTRRGWALPLFVDAAARDPLAAGSLTGDHPRAADHKLGTSETCKRAHFRHDGRCCHARHSTQCLECLDGRPASTPRQSLSRHQCTLRPPRNSFGCVKSTSCL